MNPNPTILNTFHSKGVSLIHSEGKPLYDTQIYINLTDFWLISHSDITDGKQSNANWDSMELQVHVQTDTKQEVKFK